jgi:hypothetical protein
LEKELRLTIGRDSKSAASNAQRHEGSLDLRKRQAWIAG